jgi:hypothetical protein
MDSVRSLRWLSCESARYSDLLTSMPGGGPAIELEARCERLPCLLWPLFPS